MTLGDGRHTLRADQYDLASEMLAARAIVTIARAKPKAAGRRRAASPSRRRAELRRLKRPRRNKG